MTKKRTVNIRCLLNLLVLESSAKRIQQTNKSKPHKEQIMDNWQQVALREDPHPEISFDDDSWKHADVWVGIACIASLCIATVFGG